MSDHWPDGEAPLSGGAAQIAASDAHRRSRRYTWSDPSAIAAARMSGLEFLGSLSAGKLARPPVLDTLAIDPVEVDEGRVVFEMTPAEWHYNPIGAYTAASWPLLPTPHSGAQSTAVCPPAPATRPLN